MFHNFFEKSRKLLKSQFLLDTLLPPVTLDLINFWQKLRFLQLFAIFGETAEIAEIAVFAGHPCTPSNTCRN